MFPPQIPYSTLPANKQLMFRFTLRSSVVGLTQFVSYSTHYQEKCSRYQNLLSKDIEILKDLQIA